LVTVERTAHVVNEAFGRKSTLRHIYEMWPVVLFLAPGRCRRRQKAGMPPHHDSHIDAGERPEIEVYGQKRAGDIFGGRDEARRVIVFLKIVVDGLGRMDEGHS